MPICRHSLAGDDARDNRAEIDESLLHDQATGLDTGQIEQQVHELGQSVGLFDDGSEAGVYVAECCRPVPNASSQELRRKAIDDGMITLRQSGLRKVRDGVTTLEEVARETVK